MIGISGGEPLTHPNSTTSSCACARPAPLRDDYERLSLNVERIERLNQTGLDHMQISIDNLVPDDVSKKSLKVLDKKLEMLADYADST